MLIFPFETTNHSYIYDAISNNIVRVNEVLKELIIAQNLRRNGIFKNLRNKYSQQTINNAFKSLRILQANFNAFKKSGIKRFSFPFRINYKNLKSYMEKNLSKLSLGITEQCNLRCEYCSYSGKYYKERIHSNKFMNFEIAVKAVDFFMNTTKTTRKLLINFYGGEPLLAFDLIREIVNYCATKYKDRNYTFSLNTNGTLINEKIASFLIKNDILCYISLDGPEDIHDRYRKDKRGRGSFSKIFENLVLIKSLNMTYFKEKVVFQITLSPPYDLCKVKDFFHNNPILKENFFLVNSVNMNDTTFFEDKDPKQWKLSECKESLQEEFIDGFAKGNIERLKFHIQYFLKPLMRIHKRRTFLENGFLYPNGICVPGGRKLFVNTEGDFKICEKLDNFLSIGNLFTGFDYAKIKYLISKYLSFCNKECLNCWALSLCDLCFVHSNNVDDISIDERRKFCNKVKKRFHKNLILYTTILEKNISAFDFFKEDDKIWNEY